MTVRITTSASAQPLLACASKTAEHPQDKRRLMARLAHRFMARKHRSTSGIDPSTKRKEVADRASGKKTEKGGSR
jgi:hypothetical protein